jgi:hypothetical protein
MKHSLSIGVYSLLPSPSLSHSPNMSLSLGFSLPLFSPDVSFLRSSVLCGDDFSLFYIEKRKRVISSIFLPKELFVYGGCCYMKMRTLLMETLGHTRAREGPNA